MLWWVQVTKYVTENTKFATNTVQSIAVSCGHKCLFERGGGVKCYLDIAHLNSDFLKRASLSAEKQQHIKNSETFLFKFFHDHQIFPQPHKDL